METKTAQGLKRLGHPKLPKYVKLADHFRRQMELGELVPGDRLPSFTQVGDQFGMSQHTFEKVHALLEQDGLITREPGRGIFVAQPKPIRTTRLLGVLSQKSQRENPYYVHLLMGAQDEAQRRNAEVLLLQDDVPPEWERLDGVIVMARRDYGPLGLPEELPAVTLMYGIDEVPSVTVDDSRGVRAAMDHLLDLGHRRIAYLGQGCLPRQYVDAASLARFEAYREGLSSAGVAPRTEWVRAAHEIGEPGADFAELGHRKMRAWLADGWRALGCTALVAQNDGTAIGAIEALQEAGIEVPAQVSVVGFDGLEIGRYFRPRLTTVRVPLEEVGAKAVAVLLDRSRDAPHDPDLRRSTVLPVRLEVRDSTARCHANHVSNGVAGQNEPRQ